MVLLAVAQVLGGCFDPSEAEWEVSSHSAALVAGASHSLKSVHAGKCAGVAEGNLADGGNVFQAGCQPGAHQQWQLVDLGGGYYEVINAQSGKCLDVAGASGSNGANIIQYRRIGKTSCMTRTDADVR